MQRSDITSLVNRIPTRQLLELFDLIPNVLFWAKNTDGQIVMSNRFFRDNFNLGSEADALGMTDLDFSPKQIAEQVIADDKRVIQGSDINELLEMNSLSSGEIGWFSTTKRQLLDVEGICIGTYGLSWPINQSALDKKFMNQLKEPMDYIRYNYMHPITIPTIAEHCNISVSALERRFQSHLNKSPNKFLNEFRLILGHRLLMNTSQAISEIALNIGYTDPAYFTRLYTKHYGQSPSESRLELNSK